MAAVFKFIAGLCAVVLLGAAAIGWGGAPGSAPSARARLDEEASRIAADFAPWAQFEIDGQSVRLAGEAPDREAREALIAAFEAKSGFINGPFMAVDAANVVIAMPSRLPPVVAAQPAEIIAPVDEDHDPVETLIASIIDDEASPDEREVSVSAQSDATGDSLPETDAGAAAIAQQGTPAPAQATAPAFDPACMDGVLAAAANIRISFASNRSALNDEARTALVPLSTLMSDCPPAMLVITGHTDSSGSATENLALSRERARAVADELVALGIESARIDARGVGSDQPIANNASVEGRRRNRRIEFDLAGNEE